MVTGFLKTILVGALLLAAAFPVAGAETKPLAKHGVWQTFIQPDKAKPVCFTVARPTKSEGNYSKRGDVTLIVTHRPAERSLDVVSFVAGYPLKPDGEVSVQIGKDTFQLYTVDETAWARDADEKKLLAALKAGKEAVIKGVSARGTATIDKFQLAGLQPAIAAIDKACAVKR
jgi:invasion protein IalB